MQKSEYKRLKAIATQKLKSSSISVAEDFTGKNLEELTQINEIYQAELEAQNEELQTHILDLEEAQNELEVLFTHAPVPYVLMTTNFHVLRANENIFNMFNSLHFLSKNVPFYTHIYKNHLTKFLDWIKNNKKEKLPLEILLKTKDGYKYCSLHYHKWSKENNDTFLLSIVDIHKQREENDRFKALFENTQQGIMYIDKNNIIVKLNQTARAILGEEVYCEFKNYDDLNLTFFDEYGKTVSVDDLPFAKALKTKKIQDAAVFSIYNPLLEIVKWLKIEATPHLSPENQELLGVFCIFTDVSKEYILNEKVNQELENFKTLGNNMPDVMLRIDENAHIIFANNKALEFFQIKTDEYQASKLFDFSIFRTDESKNIRKILNDLNQVSNPVTYSLNNVIGEKNFNYFIRIIPEKRRSEKKVFLLIIEDITERIESEDMFNQLFFHASDAIILKNHNTGKVKSVNNMARKILGLKEVHMDKFSSNDIFDVFQDKNALDSHLESLEKFGVDSFEITKVLENNVIQYLKVFCSLITVGKETYHQSIIHDLTEHKLLELQLQQTSKVFEHTVEGIFITDLNGAIISVNDAFTKITGYTLADVIGKKPSILKSGKHDKNFYKKMWHDIIHNRLFKGEICDKKKDGTTYPAWLTISPIFNDNNEVV